MVAIASRVCCKAPAAAGKTLKAPKSPSASKRGQQRLQASRRGDSSAKPAAPLAKQTSRKAAQWAEEFDGQELADAVVEKAGWVYGQAKARWDAVDGKLALLTVSGMTLLLLYLAFAVAEEIEHLPLAGPVLQLVGIAATYPYIVKLYVPRDRARLIYDVAALFSKMGF